MRLVVPTLILTMLIVSCQHKKVGKKSINGIWESLGSGWVLHIEDSLKYSYYDITPISCLAQRQASLEELLPDLELHSDTLYYKKGVITYKYTRVDELPKLCEQALSEELRQDLIFNFEVFAETVKEHYAFMELNKIDWEKLYTEQKGKLNGESGPTELYNVIEETFEKLNDNHAYLEATEDVYEMMEEQEAAEESNDEGESLPFIGDFGIANKVVENHLVEELTENSTLIRWGKLKDDIGYIQIKAMWLYAPLEIPDDRIEDLGYVDAYVETFNKMNESEYIKMEVEGVKKIMDRVMRDLGKTNTIVIDIRFNGGGQDAVSFEILSRFLPKKKQVATQKLRYGNRFTPVLPLYINGTSNAYTKPVYVLTSQQTGSAAEAFAIATMSMDNVKRIGTHTSGALSTALEKKLPNGWHFSISNEIYMDNGGNSYENKGIPVDYMLDYPADRQTFFHSVMNNLAGDKHKILKAIEELGYTN